MKYKELEELYACVIEGYTASSRGEFPPKNPYAMCGIRPDTSDSDDNPKGAAWFFGYWAYAYNRHGELGNFRRMERK